MAGINNPVRVNVRIEAGNGITIFEGNVTTAGHIVQTPSGGSHRSDGTNSNMNIFPGATCISALDDAANPPITYMNPFGARPFSWDGTYSSDSEDFTVTKIGDTWATGDKVWSLWLNFRSVDVGGSMWHISSGDSVLWALIPKWSSSVPLKLIGPQSATSDNSFVIQVIDGSNKSTIAGAEVGGVSTDQNGSATLKLGPGIHRLKATRGYDIASNVLEVRVS